MSAKQSPLTTCFQCSAETTQLCGKCRTVAFCSQECLKAGWKVHKKKCCKEGVASAAATKPAAAKPAGGLTKTPEEIKAILEGKTSDKPKKTSQVKQADENGAECLQASASQGHLAIAKMLFDAGAEVDHCDKFGGNALTAASEGGHLETVKWLLDQGAQVNHRNHQGNTALALAASKGHMEVAQLLGRKGGKM